jgi:hypothetical protein
MKDHRADTKLPNGIYTSKVKKHIHSEDHYFTPKDITILDKDNNWLTRGIMESLQIRALNPSINADQGCHKLPHCYDNIIRNKLAPISTHKIQAPKDTVKHFHHPTPTHRSITPPTPIPTTIPYIPIQGTQNTTIFF